MLISSKSSIINIDKLNIEIGQVTREHRNIDQILDDAEKWDRALATHYDFNINISTDNALIQLTSSLLKLVESIEKRIENRYNCFGELKLDDISTVMPLTEVLTGLEIDTFQD